MNYDFAYQYSCDEIYASTCAYCDKRLVANEGGSGPSGKSAIVFKCTDCEFKLIYFPEWIQMCISEEFSHYRLVGMNLVDQMRCFAYQKRINIQRGKSSVVQIDAFNSIVIPCESILTLYSLEITDKQIKNLNKFILLQ